MLSYLEIRHSLQWRNPQVTLYSGPMETDSSSAVASAYGGGASAGCLQQGLSYRLNTPSVGSKGHPTLCTLQSLPPTACGPVSSQMQPACGTVDVQCSPEWPTAHCLAQLVLYAQSSLALQQESSLTNTKSHFQNKPMRWQHNWLSFYLQVSSSVS